MGGWWVGFLGDELDAAFFLDFDGVWSEGVFGCAHFSYGDFAAVHGGVEVEDEDAVDDEFADGVSAEVAAAFGDFAGDEAGAVVGFEDAEEASEVDAHGLDAVDGDG